MTIPELSIIIPTTTQLTLLKNCVDSIHNSTLTNHEIIVVANSSNKDFHKETDKLKASNIKVLHINKRAGFIIPCNKGAECARGRYICVLNDDTKVGIKWARFLIRQLKNDIMQVGPSLRFIDKNFNAVEYCTSRPYIEGWCFIIDRRIYDERKMLFDNKLAWAYTEDADLSTYIMSRGYKIVKVDTLVHHNGNKYSINNKKNKNKCAYYESLNKKYLIKKWNK